MPPPEKPSHNSTGEAYHGKRVVIIDDHPLIRRGLERMIQSGDGFAVCGEAGDADEAFALVRKELPDLAIVDVSLPGTNGIDLTKKLLAEFPRLAILILSMHDEADYAVRALRAGARGYMVKQEAVEKILSALRDVMEGRVYITPSLAAAIAAPDLDRDSDPGRSVAHLSDREREVLERIGRGESVQMIAKALRLSPKTVETHRAHIKEKLKLSSAREVARFAVQWAAAREV